MPADRAFETPAAPLPRLAHQRVRDNVIRRRERAARD